MFPRLFAVTALLVSGVAAQTTPAPAPSAPPPPPPSPAAALCAASFGVFGLGSANGPAAPPTPAPAPAPAIPPPADTPARPRGKAKSAVDSPRPAPPKPVLPSGLSGIYRLDAPSLSTAQQAASPPLPPKKPIPLNAADVAAAFQGKIPGVTSLVAIGPSTLLYTIDPTRATFAPPPVTGKETAAQAVEDELIMAFDGLPTSISSDVLNLPDGFQGACAILGMVGHQVPGIVSLAVLSDTRILVGYTGSPDQLNGPLARLKDLVARLAVSNVPSSPAVQSVTMRLYYDRDAATVASVVSSAFSQLRVQSVSMTAGSTLKDTVVLADPTGYASTKTLDQARRMVAQLDEPRAQVVVNAWSLQVSHDQRDQSPGIVPQARRLAGGYNDALEQAVGLGWSFVNRIGAPAKVPSGGSLDFDPLFAGYLCGTYTYTAAKAQVVNTGLCPGSRDLAYSLGYDTLFGHEDPDLIQMMILVMATTNPAETISKTLNAMEGRDPNAPNPYDAATSCQTQDSKYYLDQQPPARKANFFHSITEHVQAQMAPRNVAFACTRAKLLALTLKARDASASSSSFVGRFRAAVADYLFQNKMKAEYPNDFEPFLYPASAATLDAVLTPVVEAFDQDLQAFQQNLQRQLTVNLPPDKHLHYTSNGLVSVKVVSGNQASVQTQSLNYFPQDPTLKLENFAKNIAAGESASVPLLAGSLSSVAATAAAYAASQPAQVTAKVGSGLSMTVTPFTLSSAKGAELSVSVIYNENGAATLSSDTTQSQASDDLNSRVSNHQITTLVRMDSLKFFEISTLQSVIARQRKPWKPFDPVFELPLLDNPGIVIARRKPEVIYNQSIIFMEASIMPTAADLGQGLLYQSDKIACGPGPARSAHRKEDFCPDQVDPLSAIQAKHQQLVSYFAGEWIDHDGKVAAPAYLDLPKMTN